VKGPIPERFLPTVHALLRIVAGLAFMSHGLQKAGFLGGFGPDGGSVELMSRFGIAATVELIGGALITVGFATRWAAFIASGEMAVAYFWIHAGGAKLFTGEGKLFWWQNRGELVMLFSFIFLTLSVWGAGPASVDAAMKKK
jgi:putative oxidoreductase